MAKKRVFLGISLSEEDRKGVDRWQRSAASALQGEDLRWIQPFNWHVTLHFLGEMASESVPKLGERLGERPLGESGVQRFGRWEAFPALDQARVLVISGHPVSPVLARLHSHLGKRLGDWGFNVESRPYVPHVTCARFGAPRAVALPSPQLPVDIEFTACTLFESVLGPTGAKYLAIKDFPLARPPQP